MKANFIAGSDTVGEQQNANAQNADAAVLGAAGFFVQLVSTLVHWGKVPALAHYLDFEPRWSFLFIPEHAPVAEMTALDPLVTRSGDAVFYDGEEIEMGVYEWNKWSNGLDIWTVFQYNYFIFSYILCDLQKY